MIGGNTASPPETMIEGPGERCTGQSCCNFNQGTHFKFYSLYFMKIKEFSRALAPCGFCSFSQNHPVYIVLTDLNSPC